MRSWSFDILRAYSAPNRRRRCLPDGRPTGCTLVAMVVLVMQLALPGVLACSMAALAALGCSATSSGPGLSGGSDSGSSSSGGSSGESGDGSGSGESGSDGSGSGESGSGGGNSSGSSGSGAPDAAPPSSGGDGASGMEAGSSVGDSGGPFDAATPGDAGACGPAGAGPAFADTSTQKATSFSDATIAPFTICTTESPDYGRASVLNGDPSIEFFWTQTGYDGTRERRGAEACSNLAFYKEGWYGFQFYLPSPGFPTDKTEGIAQIFALGGCSSWAGMLQVHGNSLWMVHRGDCAAANPDEAELAADIPRNVWNSVIIHFVVSHENAGLIEVWYGNAVCAESAPTYRKTGINLGFGTWAGDTLASVATNNIALKFGMYNFDDGNYTAGETRTIHYDNVSQLVGTPGNGWAIVNPTQ